MTLDPYAWKTMDENGRHQWLLLHMNGSLKKYGLRGDKIWACKLAGIESLNAIFNGVSEEWFKLISPSKTTEEA